MTAVRSPEAPAEANLSGRIVLGFILLALDLRVLFLLAATHPEIRAGQFTPTGDEAAYHQIAGTMATAFG